MNRPILSLIAAVARNGAIGKDNALLWREPEDQRHFRRVTLGCAVIMGRKTWDSLPERFHMRLLEIADNRWRLQLVNDLRKVMKLNRHHSLFKQGRLEASLKEHRRIMAAIKARNGERVQQLMQQHFANGKVAATLS